MTRSSDKKVRLSISSAAAEGLEELARREYRTASAQLEYMIARELGREKEAMAVYEDSYALMWEGTERRLFPMRTLSPVRLADLKEYGEEKRVIVDNTLAFLGGGRAQNVLLYGDRGTGKSSTVHAILNEFAPRGLRLIEVRKREISTLPHLLNAISRIQAQLRFIIFIDDLSFSEGQDDYGELKSLLEGSVAYIGNVLVYATSNRRHLIRETFSARHDDLHESDTREEQLSLSDRFGITITFQSPDRQTFLSIVSQILADKSIPLPADLSARCEQFCIVKGGRSARGAKQLAEMIESENKN